MVVPVEKPMGFNVSQLFRQDVLLPVRRVGLPILLARAQPIPEVFIGDPIAAKRVHQVAFQFVKSLTCLLSKTIFSGII